MHLDLNEAEAAGELRAEVCIVGGGAAGITTARRLLKLGHSVVLLESGGVDYEKPIASLNAGENSGQDYYELEEARLRFFGGTTAIWGGRIAELDPIDLERREWVPHSGWPIDWLHLQPYYRRARRVFDEPPHGASPADLWNAGAPTPEFNRKRLQIGVWTFDRRHDRFVFASCADVVNHPRCTVVTHATVSKISLDPGGRHVTSVVAQSLRTRRLTVEAETFVLAAGGIENARLLLASNDVVNAGIGNGYDQVGRYFMEHPHARGGRVVSGKAWRLLKAFTRTQVLDGRELAGLIKLSPEAQEAGRLLNSSLTVVARQPTKASLNWGVQAYMSLKHSVAPSKQGRALWRLTKSAAKWAKNRTDPLRPWLLHQMRLRDLALLIRAEQAPNPQSRVMLTNKVDALNVPRVALDWRTTELDVSSVAGLVDMLATEFQRLGLGRVERAAWLEDGGAIWRTDAKISTHPIGGYHHMGTTRMSADPRHGVTDSSGRVHGVENLYVTGSSVFPTSGWANPTLTIVALALRTSDLLSARLRRARAA